MNNWLRSKENRKLISWLGWGLVVIILGMWAASTFLGTNNILNWLLNEENRKLITWIGCGLGVIVTALWVVSLYFDHPDTKMASDSIEKAKQKKTKRRKQ
ncbi:MAG: hypothetical protein AB1461_01720 [Thermodesulfobacteriota bacterium]